MKTVFENGYQTRHRLESQILNDTVSHVLSTKAWLGLGEPSFSFAKFPVRCPQSQIPIPWCLAGVLLPRATAAGPTLLPVFLYKVSCQTTGLWSLGLLTTLRRVSHHFPPPAISQSSAWPLCRLVLIIYQYLPV